MDREKELLSLRVPIILLAINSSVFNVHGFARSKIVTFLIFGGMKGNNLKYLIYLIPLSLLATACSHSNAQIRTGADQTEIYLPMLEGKRIAIVLNHTSEVDGVHLVDTLMNAGLKQTKTGIILNLFVPEHGFRGNFDAGAKVEDDVDPVSGIPIVSLYGKHKKPTAEDLQDIDLVLFDVQDVGVRFYTYISTLHYVMEACAENHIPLIVLDRPNPNGNYIDGPILELEHQSFIGMHQVPVVYGMTIGELAQMINGEGWLAGGVQCELTVVPCAGYSHSMYYSLPVDPSPNLPNDHSISLYPSTCFFEGTVISEGRGTLNPFEVFGHPDLPGNYAFTPRSMPGKSTYPKLEGKKCYGTDLRRWIPEEGWTKLHMEFLINAYRDFPDKDKFFIPSFEKLAGTSQLREQIRSGMTADEIQESWKEDLHEFMKVRKKYLIYK